MCATWAAGGEVGGDHGKRNHLFLKQRNTQCAFENGPEAVERVVGLFFAITPF